MKINNPFTSLGIMALIASVGSTILTTAPQSHISPPVFFLAGNMALPANAQAGKCYAPAFNNPKYQSRRQNAFQKPLLERIMPLPANYQPTPKTIKESKGQGVWQEVSCRTATPRLVKSKVTFSQPHAPSRPPEVQNKKDWLLTQEP